MIRSYRTACQVIIFRHCKQNKGFEVINTKIQKIITIIVITTIRHIFSITNFNIL